MSLQKEFKTGIEEFVREFVGNERYRGRFPAKAKIIHDPLWGTIRLEPWEVALLDLPLIQRLRQIHQTSLVSYVFPGCSHTRFEHTMGVIQQAQKLIDAVNKQYAPRDEKFTPETIRNIRIAALFHDCGHSCFSHISEDLYESCTDMEDFFQSGEMPKCHPHEALSALILKSGVVRQYMADIEAHYGISLDLDKAADMIVGIPVQNDKTHLYETQVINGPFDADKLDYIFRDSHYSGIPIGLDLDRLWSSCMVSKTDSGEHALTLHHASIAPLEQVLFSKMNLFSIVYQHPKVRAAEKMFQAVIEEAQARPDDVNFTVAGRKLNLNRATDHLWMTDEVFFSEALHRKSDDYLHKKVHDIRYRRFLVRALTISNDTVEEDCRTEGFLQLKKLNQRCMETYKAKREIAREIIHAAGLDGKLDVRDVWLDLPSDPSFNETDRTFVLTSSSGLRKVSELFPINYWTELYQKYKWRGHVFCPVEYQQRIYEAALDFFRQDPFALKFKKSAGEISHVPHPLPA
ncbi:MAG: hypothetical protein CSYNP_00349 [Syntrophus sp. SKADARSKE-3]|nr:hypothetical protein [Syntrophus sp. SKADARSKE-3]